MSAGVAFIIGGGPRIGYAVAHAFSRDGYKVALSSRNPSKEVQKNGWLPVEMDVSDSNAIRKGFEKVSSALGLPNVVVYNAAALNFAQPEHPFGLTVDQYKSDLDVNLMGGYVSLHEAVAAFRKIPASTAFPRVFIATGNVVPWQPVPFAPSLGSQKAGLAHLIELGNAAYAKDGYRFYFASQITADGGPVPYEDIIAEAHGRVYSELVERSDLGRWDVRFVE